jgi:hypothetical protein
MGSTSTQPIESCDHKRTKDFKIIEAGTEKGIKIEGKSGDFTFEVAFTSHETNQLGFVKITV